MRYLIILILLIGCTVREVVPPTPPPTPPPVPVVVIEKKADESELDAMKREKREAVALIAQLQSKVTNLDSQIKTVEEENVKWYAKLIGYSCIGLAMVLLVASFFTMQYPILPKVFRYASYILGSCGFLALVYSAMFGYFLIIGVGVAIIIIGTAIWLWHSDRRALKQVVSVVDDTKHEIKDYKTKFKKKIDSRADKWLNKARGLK